MFLLAKARSVCLVVASVLVLATASANQAALKAGLDIDSSGIDAFWRIYDVLSNDREPTQQEWDKLFSTPGYALLDAKERRRKSLTEAFRLVYMPSKASEKETIVKSGKGIALLLPHLIEIPNHRKELAEFSHPDRIRKLVVEARRKAQAFLPAGTTERIPPPPISFVFFQSRGYSERILLDALELMQHPNQVGLVGHELHHHYRNKSGRGTRPLGDDMLAWAILNVEYEGIAGKVDKDEVPEMSVAELERRYINKRSLGYFKQYQIEYARSNEWLKFTSNLLEQIADNPEQKVPLGVKLHRELPDNGRAMGTYMAGVIIKRLGRKRFLKTVGDPFGFWQAYNEAAKRSNGQAYVISRKALGVIERTRDLYQISNEANPSARDNPFAFSRSHPVSF